MKKYICCCVEHVTQLQNKCQYHFLNPLRQFKKKIDISVTLAPYTIGNDLLLLQLVCIV